MNRFANVNPVNCSSISLVLSFTLLFIVKNAFSCEAKVLEPRRPTQGFAYSPKEVIHLPSNAQGIIFYNRNANKTLPSAEAIHIIEKLHGKDKHLKAEISRITVRAGKPYPFSDSIIRIAPKGGFKKKAIYEFTYRNGDEPDGEDQILRVLIDDRSVPISGGEFGIETKGPTTIYARKTNNSCGSGKLESVVGQEVTFKVPPEFLPYKDLLYFSLDFAIDKKYFDINTNDAVVPYPLTYSVGVQRHGNSALNMLGEPREIGKEMVYSSCNASSPLDRKGFVEGHAGILEVSEKLFDTFAIPIRLDGPQQGKCS